jgi:tetratricopeptide (TPR) repeat protein
MDSVPEIHEAQRQLGRMLSSSVFRSAPRLSPLLKHIVEVTLAENGTKDSTRLGEHQIGFAVFENYSPDSSAVRTNVTLLRARIERYYVECGAEDPVLIRIPPGGYRAAFSYNPKSPADKLYRRGWSQVSGFVPSEHEHASLQWFKEAIEADPNHAGAHAAKAEAELREMFYRRTIPPHDPVAAAGTSAREALRLQPNSWRAHVALGAVHCCRREWELAARSFDAAIAIAPGLARDHSWYAGFLMAGGRDEDALRLARSRAGERPQDDSAQIALGFFLYLARRFDEAEECLNEVIGNFPKSWLAGIVLACVDLAKDSAVDGLVRIRLTHRLLCELNERSPQRNEVFPGLINLCRLRHWEEADHRLAREDLKSAFSWDRWSASEKKGGVLPGDADEKPGHYDIQIRFWTPLQIALGFIGLEKKESAIEALSRAMDEGDPLAVLFPRLPLLDPLRGEPAFQELVKRVDLAAFLP